MRKSGAETHMRGGAHAVALSWLACGLGVCALVAIQAQAADEKGLILRLETLAGKSDTRESRTVTLHVPKGQSPSPFLRGSDFTARWEGKLLLEKRSRLVFHLEGTGEAKLRIDDDLIVSAIGTPSESKRLSSGEHDIVVEYQPPVGDDATLRLLWEGRDFSKEPIDPEVFRHDGSDAALEGFSALRRGRSLVAQKRCGSCHSSGTEELMPELLLKGPSLDGIGGRLRHGWLTRWILDPRQMRPQSHMPAVFRGEGAEEKAAHVAAYLSAGSDPGGADPLPEKERVEKGGAIFRQQNCISCHTLAETGEGQRIGLGGVGMKFHPEALVKFLQDPAKFHQGTRMPAFGFDEEEALSVASFLRSLGAKTDSQPLKGDASKGRVLAQSAGCFNCHEREGEQKESLTEIGLFDLTSSECSEVGYELSSEMAAELRAFLTAESGQDSLAQFIPAEYAERQYQELRCNACHTRDGEDSLRSNFLEEVSRLGTSDEKVDEAKPAGLAGPPPLDHLGFKLKLDWRTRLFAGEIQPKVRRWLPDRMPAFHSRSSNLALGFSHAAGRSGLDRSPKVLDTEKVGVGRAMTGVEAGLSCGACHGIGDKAAIAVFEGEGPNLRASGERLTPDYFHLWMNDPPRVWPGTIMPKYALDGKTPLTQYYDGDSRKQFEAILQYLRSLSKNQNNEKNP